MASGPVPDSRAELDGSRRKITPVAKVKVFAFSGATPNGDCNKWQFTPLAIFAKVNCIFRKRWDLPLNKLLILLLMGTLPAASAFSQKVKIGYDKSVDFSKFATYTWVEPTTRPQWPLLYKTVVSRVDDELQSKGLTRVAQNGDLKLMPAGGVDFGTVALTSQPNLGPPSINSTMWTGPSGPSMGTDLKSEGTLMLTFVERSTNKEVWAGSVTQNLDLENKIKSLDLAEKAVTKLLKQFPPKKK